MLMLLNGLDLCVCIMTVMVQILRLSSQKTTFWMVIRNVFESLYVIFVEGTGFKTFLQSITVRRSTISKKSSWQSCSRCIYWLCHGSRNNNNIFAIAAHNGNLCFTISSSCCLTMRLSFWMNISPSIG